MSKTPSVMKSLVQKSSRCWPLNWTLPGVRTAYLFFPLWLGYILFVDALVQRSAGLSFARVHGQKSRNRR